MKSVKDRSIPTGFLFILFLTLAGCSGISGQKTKENKIMLWNGKDLTGWKVVNQDDATAEVWSVKDDILYCQGRPTGYIRTEREYSNYHLHVEWRWPENAAEGRGRNSGVFVHMNGPDQIWPQLIECQLMANQAGQFVLMNGMGMTVDGQKRQNPNAQFLMVQKQQESSENPAGEWNCYDIYCKGDTIQCFVNEVLQNEGSAVTQSSGYICLQSEGSPIEFRNIYIEPIEQE